ncbi:hypothetical protein BCR36DRAFT_586613 [Piromyces finnis]|uniref:DUF2828 domain-containing protein n=1 Tax=Piromyces finnis TaxID=1754191 RepID=A0A1Y1V052_9FUNG|nr:hypothetical protein BCR36DRAFT_586613 [Piromyces finnis]|eukprot:ORX43673.1 hypothetical protein BCR36DRAFT_586613 [Piromyces finnis]
MATIATIDNNNLSYTENGAIGYKTSGKDLLDINFAISSMRNMDESQIIEKYIKAFNEENMLAVKWLFMLEIILINEFKYNDKKYRKMLSQMRSFLKVVEVSMSAKKWSEINYSAVPSRANLIYNKAFLKNDTIRRKEFLEKTMKGLPDYVNGNGNTICVADSSGSMCCNASPNSSVTYMEFDSMVDFGSYQRSQREAFFSIMKRKFKSKGYLIPRLVFGISITDPFECLLEQLNSERYQPIEDALKD